MKNKYIEIYADNRISIICHKPEDIDFLKDCSGYELGKTAKSISKTNNPYYLCFYIKLIVCSPPSYRQKCIDIEDFKKELIEYEKEIEEDES